MKQLSMSAEDIRKRLEKLRSQQLELINKINELTQRQQAIIQSIDQEKASLLDQVKQNNGQTALLQEFLDYLEKPQQQPDGSLQPEGNLSTKVS
jgi:uncharacterized coiled-coil DUF342 family protein